MRSLFLLLLCLCCQCFSSLAQNNILKGTGSVSFAANGPLNLIKATSPSAGGFIDTRTGKIRFEAASASFQFAISLMQERFNDKYMQSSRHPRATFVGELVGVTLPLQEITQEVMAKGILTIHGIPQKRTIKGTLTRHGDALQLVADFAVNLQDHAIEAPKLTSGVAAENINVLVDMLLQPASKPVAQRQVTLHARRSPK
ncbi:YceI family protein [Pontibacter ruber]|uniref:YceI family protein n=1 Tax=Pontibacter ruber TaxID=1343895 RepID=A0ABW5CXU9_9BACT|nr:YceI family protein [Pontibacter ruber]